MKKSSQKMKNIIYKQGIELATKLINAQKLIPVNKC
jgi:hypothetical protein